MPSPGQGRVMVSHYVAIHDRSKFDEVLRIITDADARQGALLGTIYSAFNDIFVSPSARDSVLEPRQAMADAAAFWGACKEAVDANCGMQLRAMFSNVEHTCNLMPFVARATKEWLRHTLDMKTSIPTYGQFIAWGSCEFPAALQVGFIADTKRENHSVMRAVASHLKDGYTALSRAVQGSGMAARFADECIRRVNALEDEMMNATSSEYDLADYECFCEMVYIEVIMRMAEGRGHGKVVPVWFLKRRVGHNSMRIVISLKGLHRFAQSDGSTNAAAKTALYVASLRFPTHAVALLRIPARRLEKALETDSSVDHAFELFISACMSNASHTILDAQVT